MASASGVGRGRPPVLKSETDLPKVTAYYTAAGRPIPPLTFGKGRTTADEKARRDALRAKVHAFNSLMS
jgi:hypothetical protein